MSNSKFPTSRVLVLGSDSVYTLLPPTFISRADALLAAHRIEDVVELAEQQQLEKARDGAAAADTDDVRYAFQRIGFQCLTETLFDDAGRHLLAGELDPRVLISYYPDLRGSLFGEDDEVDVYAGVAGCMPPEASIDDIITINLVRNYSPHLAPNTSTAPAAVELRKVLMLAATDMLTVFLRKWRAKYRRADGRRVNEVVDTVLCKLYTTSTSNQTTDLLALIDGPNDIVLSEIEHPLQAENRYDALCRLYKTRGEEDKLMGVWSRLVTGEIVDEEFPDPLDNMFAHLQEKRDKHLAQKWGVWLIKWDSERALKLLTTVGANKRKASVSATDDVSLLNQINVLDPVAGALFLEYLLFQRRSQSADLHTQLASTYVAQIQECLNDESTLKLWRAKAASFASPAVAQPPRAQPSFLAYFASTTPDSPAKRTRLKLALFLQTSRMYDADVVLDLLESGGEERRKVFALERAVVLGKLGRHREALSLLIHTLRDSTSAETYCALSGRGVVPNKTAQALAERHEISMLVVSTKGSESEDEEQVKRELTRVLLEVYMSGGESMAERTARLLDAQGMNLDVLEVLPLIPSPWPLRTLASFLTRSLRRSLHTRHEAQLVKALAASESLAVAEETWEPLREGGMIVEEAIEDESDFDGYEKDAAGSGEEEEEELRLDEKTPLVDERPQRTAARGYDVGGGDDDDADSVL